MALGQNIIDLQNSKLMDIVKAHLIESGLAMLLMWEVLPDCEAENLTMASTVHTIREMLSKY